VEFAEDKSVIEVIEKEMLKKGKFIVATNELDSEKLSDEEVLKAYKCGGSAPRPRKPCKGLSSMRREVFAS